MFNQNWPDGPWQREPDRCCWIDEASGLPCVIARDTRPDHGELWGHVAVPLGHAFHGHGRHTPLLESAAKIRGDRLRGTSEYPAGTELFPANLWWFGFHASQLGRDLIPGLHPDGYADECWYFHQYRSERERPVNPAQLVYRDWEFIKAEVLSLAKRLAAIPRTYWTLGNADSAGPVVSDQPKPAVPASKLTVLKIVGGPFNGRILATNAEIEGCGERTVGYAVLHDQGPYPALMVVEKRTRQINSVELPACPEGIEPLLIRSVASPLPDSLA